MSTDNDNGRIYSNDALLINRAIRSRNSLERKKFLATATDEQRRKFLEMEAEEEARDRELRKKVLIWTGIITAIAVIIAWITSL